MIDSLELFERVNVAGALSGGPDRVAALLDVAREIECALSTAPTRADATELQSARAAALAMAAYDDSEYLEVALSASKGISTHSAVSTLTWAPWLAEALLKHGEPRRAIDVLSSIDLESLEDADLHWRAVRIDEIRAAALITLDRFDEATLVVKRLARALASEAGDDFLPSPTEAVEQLLALESGTDERLAQDARRLLRFLVEDLDVEAWFPKATAAALRMAASR